MPSLERGDARRVLTEVEAEIESTRIAAATSEHPLRQVQAVELDIAIQVRPIRAGAD